MCCVLGLKEKGGVQAVKAHRESQHPFFRIGWDASPKTSPLLHAFFPNKAWLFSQHKELASRALWRSLGNDWMVI
jgi:hypothetical protein